MMNSTRMKKDKQNEGTENIIIENELKRSGKMIKK
jgi:hypothetical protein